MRHRTNWHADNLRRRMLERGVGHRELARKIGVSHATIGRILAGKQDPWRQLDRLSNTIDRIHNWVYGAD